MASTEMTTGILNLRDGDWSSRASKACDFIASACGLSLSGSTTSGSTVIRHYTYGTGIGINLSYTSGSSGSINAYAVYMNSSGEWTTIGKGAGGVSVPGSGDKSEEPANKCYLYSKKMEVGSLTATQFAFDGQISSFYFIPFTATDYFSGESRTGFVTNGEFFTYCNTTRRGENMGVYSVTEGSYPTERVLTVADPVILKSGTFYSLTDKLYYIAGVGASLGDQIQLSGNTFIHISGSVFAS